MDLGGMVGMDGLVGASFHCGGVFISPRASSDPESNKQNGFLRSGLLKEGRPCGPEEHDWRYLKLARTEVPSLFPDGEQMLSFSSSNPDAFLFSSEPPSSAPLASSYVGNAVGWGSFHLGFSGNADPEPGRCRRTDGKKWRCSRDAVADQKYCERHMNRGRHRSRKPVEGQTGHAAKVMPIIAPAPTAPAVSGSGSSNSFTMAQQQMNDVKPRITHSSPPQFDRVDPEPGRCRRTDGKKWRCSRDAVADQKYCERHMNRGRHRSRKPVEGQTGHAAKVMPIIAPAPTAPAVSGSGSSNSFTMAQQQMNDVKPRITHSSPPQFDRVLANNELNDSHDLSMLNSVNSELTETLFPIADHQHKPFEKLPSRANYGLISDSPFKLPNNSYLGNDNFVSSVEFHDQDCSSNPLRHFIDDWHKSHSDSSTINWTEREIQSDKTQLSIAIPVAPSDFSSSSSSPMHEKHTPSSLKLSLDFDPDNANVGGGGHPNDGNQRQASWLRTSWGSSMGGPLGEVLANTCNNLVDHDKNCSSLHLMTNGWDSSPRLRSSPTGALQKF
ncbi:growth-regulating factor 6-like [Cocos nucifera]|nr:growth-regulating factor 6-like [Cocos nucifera]